MNLMMRLNMSNSFIVCGDLNFIMDTDLELRASNLSFAHRSKTLVSYTLRCGLLIVYHTKYIN
jgi:hypothetical protein